MSPEGCTMSLIALTGATEHASESSHYCEAENVIFKVQFNQIFNICTLTQPNIKKQKS